jgi:hypothetical protein
MMSEWQQGSALEFDDDVELADASASLAATNADRSDPVTAGDDTLLRCLLASGMPDAANATGRAVVAYWNWLRTADVAARRALSDSLRRKVERGQTGLRAWVPVILGDHDFSIVHAAVLGYVGTRPVSVDRLERCTADALDWLRRGLALNRVAVFAALLDRADEALLGRLRGLRSALTTEEARAVWSACNDVRDCATREFIAEWRTTFG